MKYEIDINNDENDKFDIKGDNVATLKVYDKNNKDITEKTTVQIFLSKNALLGLGTELIRFAHNYREGRHWHIEPAEAEYRVQTMGIFLTPDSTELIILCGDHKVIGEYFLED